MPLKFEMENLDDVHEEVAKLYTKEGDKFYLSGVAGIAPKSKVDEFRDKNVDLMKKYDAVKDIDPAAYKQMQSDIEKFKAQKPGATDEEIAARIEKVVTERTGTMKTEYETTINANNETISKQGRQLESLLIDNAVSTAALEHGVLDSAMADVTLRAKTVFKVEEGQVVGYNDGEKLYDATGVKLLTVNKWVKGLAKNASHLFVTDKGGDLRKGSRNLSKKAIENMTASEKIRAGLDK